MSEDLRDWAVDNMVKFIEILQPEIEKYQNEKLVKNKDSRSLPHTQFRITTIL